MGSIADEMKKVLQMWDEDDQSQQEKIPFSLEFRRR